MKIGVFDSGLGGLIVTKAFLERLGQYDYVYLGDTKNLPYGEKKSTEVLEMTIKGMEFLINQGAKIIIIACNTASCVALRYLQRVYMPRQHPEIKVLGVIVPTVEEAISHLSSRSPLSLRSGVAVKDDNPPPAPLKIKGGENLAIGVVATKSTIHSHIYRAEIQKINPVIEVMEMATPELVPLIEAGDMNGAERAVKEDVELLLHQGPNLPISSLILGCTHYPMVKEMFRNSLPSSVKVISQDEFMGDKLADYLARHAEIESVLSQNGSREFFVTAIQPGNIEGAKRIIKNARLELVEI